MLSAILFDWFPADFTVGLLQYTKLGTSGFLHWSPVWYTVANQPWNQQGTSLGTTKFSGPPTSPITTILISKESCFVWFVLKKSSRVNELKGDVCFCGYVNQWRLSACSFRFTTQPFITPCECRIHDTKAPKTKPDVKKETCVATSLRVVFFRKTGVP